MKVLLYYPPVTPQTAFPTWEPLQLIFLARELRQQDIEVEILDGRLFEETEKYEQIKRTIAGGATCIGITALTCYQLIDALDVASFVKEQFPDLPVIFGGWHASIFPEETLREKGVDIVVRGQGEITFPEVLERIQHGSDLTGVQGVSWKQNGAIVHEEDRPFVSPNELPRLVPSDFQRLDLKHYQLNRVFFSMSSVGCPYSCKYCCVSLTCKRKWLPLSADRVVDELKALHDAFHFNEVVFWDNVFFTSRKRVEEICRRIIHEKIPISWSAHGRINEIVRWDDRFIRLLKDGGCKSIFIGAESGSQDMLERIDKKIRDVDILPSFRKLRGHDIDVAVNWMVGLPHETYADVVKTIRCIKEGLGYYDYDLDKFRVHIYRFVPFPGTPIFNELKREEADRFPKSARAWGTFIYEKIRDGLEPWNEENGPSKFASTTFYLWKAYLEREQPKTFPSKALKRIAQIRIQNGFLRVPVEWWLWKRRLKNRLS